MSKFLLKSYKPQEVDYEFYENLKKEKTFPFVKRKDILYYYFEKDGYAFGQYLCNYFEIIEIIVDEASNQHSLKIIIYHNSEERETVLPLSAFSSRNIHSLRDVGILYNPYNAGALLAEYVDRQVLLMDKTVHHNKVGWFTNKDGELEFLGYDDEYTGDICLASSSDNAEEQIQGLNDLIVDSVPCQIAMASGLSSCLIGLLNELGEVIEPPIFHFYGDSSTGKSTALMLGASVWGKPEFGNDIFQSWNATNNAIMNSLNNNHGVVLALDESSVSNKEFTNLVYCMSQGIEKGRLNKNCSKREQRSWNTSIISSGENSIVNNCKKNTGISARVIEFPNVKITNSAEHSENIKRFCLKNYGAIGQAFVDVICNNELDKTIREEYSSLREEISNQINEGTAIDNRLCRYYAILGLCSRYAKEYLALNINKEKIIEFLIENNQSIMPKTTMFEKAYAYINEWVTANPSAFFNGENTGTNKVGFIRKGRVHFFKTAFQKILKEGGFSDYTVVLHIFKEHNVLHCEGDRLEFRTTINNRKVDCYAINLDVETDKILEALNEIIEGE